MSFDKLSPKLQSILKKRGFDKATLPQELGIPEILSGRNVLVIAETGSGKTESVALPIFDLWIKNKEKLKPISILYITPLKSLNRDLFKRFLWWGKELDMDISVRHGDTTQYERKKQVDFPDDMLIVTPETLQAILPAKRMKEHLRNIKWVIVDEVHELVSSKRGIQLSIGLERLRELCGDFQLISLSATVGFPEYVANFISGGRPTKIIRATTEKQFDIQVISPKIEKSDNLLAEKIYSSTETAARLRTVHDLIKNHTSTLSFTNTRDFAEILTSRLRQTYPNTPIENHHSSLSKSVRIDVEEKFRNQELKSIVCIHEDELVYTIKGLKKAKEVIVGDEILSYDIKTRKGTFRPITKKYKCASNELIKIKHEMGIISVTPEHPLLCMGRDGFEWKMAKNLKDNDVLVTVGKIFGKKEATIDFITYFKNVFVDNKIVKKLGYKPVCPHGGMGTRLSILKKMMDREDLLLINELYTKSGKKYYLPYFLTSDLGYLFGFKESDGREDLVLFNTNLLMLNKIKKIVNKITNRTPEIKSCNWSPGCYYISVSSRLFENILAEMKNRILNLPNEVKYGILAGYLDGDGSLTITVKRNRSWLKRIVFSTSSLEHKEYILYLLLSLGFKPKVYVYKNKNYYEVYLTYVDDKIKFLENIKNSIKVSNFPSNVTLGIKQQTFYGLGSYLRLLRRSLKIPTRLLERNTSYNTSRHENSKRGISIGLLRKVNRYFKSQLLEELVSHKFSLSRVKQTKKVIAHYNVVNFETKDTNTYVVGGIVTHNCTSSLELGIDIGSINYVIQYQSPRQPSKLIQRVGRSGHSLKKKSQGVIIATDIDDVFESAVIAKQGLEGKLEPIVAHEKALDVLANQIVGMTRDKWDSTQEEIYKLVKHAYPYRDLTKKEFLDVCQQLNVNRYLFLDSGRIKGSRKGLLFYFTNLSTIPDTKNYLVINMVSDKRVGTLDEEFVALHGSTGVTFVMKGETWRVISVDGRKIYVEPSGEVDAAIPGWEGDLMPVPYQVAQEVGHLRKIIANSLGNNPKKKVQEEYSIDDNSAKKMIDIIQKQKKDGFIPTNHTVLVESQADNVVIHTCLGTKGNETLGRFLSAALAEKIGSVNLRTDPYRIILQLQIVNQKMLEDIILKTKPDDLEFYLEKNLSESRLFQWRFIHVAKKFGIIRRDAEYGRIRMSKIIDLYSGTPVWKETLREIKTDKLDVDLVKKFLKKLQEKRLSLIFRKGLSPLGELGIKERPELIGSGKPDLQILDIFGKRLNQKRVRLVCLNCGDWSQVYTVGELSDEIRCPKCHAKLIGMCGRTQVEVQEYVKKKLQNKPLGPEEQKRYERLRDTSDLIIVYGKKAVKAIATRGVGAKTAKRIFRGMYLDEKDFLKALLDAERVYIKNKKYWG